jgi:hypothetical protein
MPCPSIRTSMDRTVPCQYHAARDSSFPQDARGQCHNALRRRKVVASDQAGKPAAEHAPARGPATVARPDVEAAFSVGWRVAELYHARLPVAVEDGDRADDQLPDQLPGIGSLSRAERARLIVGQIAADLERAVPERKAADVAAIQQALGASSKEGIRRAVYDVHCSLLSGLTATDFHLGKAYGLGRALAETVLLPASRDPSSYGRVFNPHRVRMIRAWLADLHSYFQASSTEAVEHGLATWSAWVRTPDFFNGRRVSWKGDGSKIRRALTRQGDVWRGLLSGEKDPVDLLELNDYVRAATGMAGTVAKLAGSFLVATPLGILLFVLALAATAALAYVVLAGIARDVIAGAIVLFGGTLGVTTGSVVASVKKVLAQAEEPLWQAELTRSIGVAALVEPDLRRDEAEPPAATEEEAEGLEPTSSATPGSLDELVANDPTDR